MQERPPYAAYAAIMGAFFGGLAATGVLARALGREPREHDTLDLLTLIAANFKASRTLAHDEVTSFLREPFVQGHAHEGGEEPEQGGGRQAVGELVTCTRCIGTWTAAGLAATQVLWPLRPRPHVDSLRRRRQRLPAGGIRRTRREGERDRSAGLAG